MADNETRPCPNCSKPVPIDATRCINCWASFSAASMPKASVGEDATLSHADSSRAGLHPESVLAGQRPVPGPVSVQGNSGLLIIFSVVFLVTAVVFCGMGLKETYAYQYDDKIVGGDAYNFIILAARGTGLICVGIVSALIGVALAIFDLASRSR